MGVIVCFIGYMFCFKSLLIRPEILNLVDRIDEFNGVWRTLGTLTPDCLSALRRVAAIESIGSTTRKSASSFKPSRLLTRPA
jgi:hypothetical protein